MTTYAYRCSCGSEGGGVSPLPDGRMKCRDCGAILWVTEYIALQRDRAVIARIGGRLLTLERIAQYDWPLEVEAEQAAYSRINARFPAPLLPESAFDWPIYRAAVVADVYGALWGQASEAEERVLDTLAHCAGLTVALRPSNGG